MKPLPHVYTARLTGGAEGYAVVAATGVGELLRFGIVGVAKTQSVGQRFDCRLIAGEEVKAAFRSCAAVALDEVVFLL